MKVEHEVTPVVTAWLKGTKQSPYSAKQTVGSVMARVPEIPQRRHRRWSVPFARRSAPADSAGSTIGPAPPSAFTGFSPLEFIAVAAIVVLFGGFLLAGVLTTRQGEEMPAAAATESPLPMTTEELLSGMATEEVAPGVIRVTDDGVRDLTSVDAVDIVAGFDGGTWLVRQDDFLRAGSDRSYAWPDVGPGDHAFEVAPDGTMWVIPCGSGRWPEQCGDALRSTDGEEWTLQPCPQGSARCVGFTVALDGTVWASWKLDGRWRVGQLGPTDWQDGYTRSDKRGYQRMFVTAAGDIYGLDVSDIYRFADGRWESFSEQPMLWGNGALVDVGRDGTVWLGNDDGLTRFADGEWEHWTTADILGSAYDFTYYNEPGVDYIGETQFEVAPDGSLWFSPWQRCPTESGSFTWCRDGLARFDGQTLDRFLRGQCISMDIAADGSVWVLAADETSWDLDVWDRDGRGPRWVLDDDGPRSLYVISVEVVAAAE